MYFDDNYWSKVNLSLDASTYVHYEVIYTAKRNTTSICLAKRFPDQIPFLTALELRSLDGTMYNRVGPHYDMFYVTRNALIIRYVKMLKKVMRRLFIICMSRHVRCFCRLTKIIKL